VAHDGFRSYGLVPRDRFGDVPSVRADQAGRLLSPNLNGSSSLRYCAQRSGGRDLGARQGDLSGRSQLVLEDVVSASSAQR